MNKHLAQIAGSTTLRFKTDILAAALAIVATCLLAGCKTENPATVTDNRELAASTIARPSVIYVTDFELGVENIKHEDGKLSGKSGVVGRVGGRLSGTSSDPEARARKLVDLMSSSLVKDLCQAGFNAFRLPPGTALPAEGWLIRGVFTEVQEGNRLRRSMIGFGKGQTDVQVMATVHDLAHGSPKPLDEIATDAASGSKPGAAPTIVLGPYGAAARFVMSGKDLDKNVKQTASQITARIVRRVEGVK
jgi:hypothetical protein